MNERMLASYSSGMIMRPAMVQTDRPRANLGGGEYVLFMAMLKQH